MNLHKLMRQDRLTPEMIKNATADELNYQDAKDGLPLQNAIYSQKPELIKAFIENELCDLNLKSKFATSAIYIAILQNDIETVKLLVNSARFNSVNMLISKWKITPLVFALHQHQDEIAKILINCQNIDINIPSIKKLTPLHRAVEFNNNQTVKAILGNQNLKNVNDNNNDEGITPFHLATKSGNKEIVEILMEHKDIDINMRTKIGYTPLHGAVEFNNNQTVKAILGNQNLKNVNDNNNDEGITPFHLAVKNSNKELVEILMGHQDIDINMSTKAGYTPLHGAVMYNNSEAVAAIIGNKNLKNVNDNKNDQSIVPLHIGAKTGNKALVEILMSHQDIDIVDKEGFTALHSAVEENDTEMVELLINSGANVNTINTTGETPLHLAVKLDDIAMVQTLIKHPQIDLDCPNLKSKFGLNALQYSLVNENFIISKLLINSGANINFKTKTGCTVFHYATVIGNDEMLDFLIANGADVSAKDNYGQDALEWAIRNNKKNLAWKISSYIVANDNSQNITSQAIEKEKEFINIHYHIAKVTLKDKYYELLHDPVANKILVSFNNDNYIQHAKVVNEFFSKYEKQYKKITKINKEFITEENKLFLKNLRRYQKDIENLTQKLSTIRDSNIYNKKEKINLQKNASNVQAPLQQFSLSRTEEKRSFLKKERKIPKYQRPKEKNSNDKNSHKLKLKPHSKDLHCKEPSNKEEKSNSFSHHHLHSSLQHNIDAIKQTEKWFAKQSIDSKEVMQLKGKIAAANIPKEFENLQESFISLNIQEFQAESKWWYEKIINFDENNIDKLAKEIKDKIASLDIKERKLNLEQLTILQLAKENQDAELATIIKVNRGELWDHRHGRPAISLGKTIDNGKELVIVGTTREIKGLSCFTLNLVEDKTTYFYFKNIITIEKEDNKGWWDKENKLTLTQNEIATLFAQIDDYNEKNANFLHQVNNDNQQIAKDLPVRNPSTEQVDSVATTTWLETQWDATGAKPKNKFNDTPKLFPQKELLSNEPQAGTSFDRSIIFNLEAETAKVAEQMLAQQAKEKQAREKSSKEETERKQKTEEEKRQKTALFS
ncbi:ankyrin repeat domain-containing protein [Spiroplasma endosymbiont of Calodromius spilotus]|uniref:ankyrin repeat domain-containing protein n=1 Tax=Spiroplasma endosymbiont of Calodromius spilotus TaxID=3077929 RepID=UPI0031FE6F92